jgi:hypothetical protein
VVVAAVRAPSRSPRGGDAREDELVLKVWVGICFAH